MNLRDDRNTPTILRTIVEHKRREVEDRKQARPTVRLSEAPPVRDFTAALRCDTVALIAEVKQASPSKGVLRNDFDPLGLAEAYADHGAACLSVLTDEKFFRGNDDYLRRIRERVGIPLLRKEFIIDPWQIAESRALGADAILLIVAILTFDELRLFSTLASELGMASLIETHTDEELDVALGLDSPLIGVNNRNLHTFETSLETTERLGPRVAADPSRLLVSESGIASSADVDRVAAAGARAILVGEALVREGRVTDKVRELSARPLA